MQRLTLMLMCYHPSWHVGDQEARRLIDSFSNAIPLVSPAVAPAPDTLMASFPTMAPATQPPHVRRDESLGGPCGCRQWFTNTPF
jgi:hypothetical protein